MKSKKKKKKEKKNKIIKQQFKSIKIGNEKTNFWEFTYN